jgi:hypothetical protein
MRLGDRSLLRRWLRLILFASLSLAVMALTFSVAAAQAQTFSTPVTLSRVAVYPQMAMDSSGNLSVAWVRMGPDDHSVFFSRSADSGTTFSTPIPVLNSQGNGGPQVAIDSSGGVDLVWLDHVDNNLHFTRSVDGGITFSPATTIAIGVGLNARMAVDASGNINVAWQQESNTQSGNSVWFSRSTNGGTNFSAPQMLSTPGAGSFFPRIAVNASGDIYVIWTGLTGFNCDVWLSYSKNAAATFSQPLNLSNSAACASFDSSDLGVNHQIVIDSSGSINLTWTDSAAGIIFRRSTDAGATFSTPTIVSTGYTASPQIAVDSSGQIDVVWSATDTGTQGGHPNVFFSRSSDGGVTFFASTQLNTLTPPPKRTAQSGGYEAQIGLTPSGKIIVVWKDSNFTGLYQGSELFFSASSDGGATFSIPTKISSNPGVSDGQLTQIAIDAEGNIALLWSCDSGGNDSLSVFFSRATADGSSGADFTISAAPASLVVLPGGAATAQVTLTSTGGFNQAVNLSCSKLTPGAACSFDSASVTPTDSGAKVNVTLTIPPTMAQGNFTFTISAASGNTTHTQDMQAAVGGLSGSVAPAALTIAAGSASNFTVTVNSTGGFSGQVSLACSGAPAGVACSFSPPQFSVQASATATSTLTVQVSTKPSGSLAPSRPQALPTANGILPIASFVLLLLFTMAFALARGVNGSRATIARALGAIVLTIALAAAMVSCGGATTSSKATSGGTAASGSGGAGSTGSTSSVGGAGSGGSGGSTAGSTSVSFPMTVQAQSGSAIVNLGTINVTVP